MVVGLLDALGLDPVDVGHDHGRRDGATHRRRAPVADPPAGPHQRRA
jgi:hypothetical protein